MGVLRGGRGHLFLTGRAGTGKTFFLERAREELSASRNLAVVAPSGVAAINARGKTIHSFFRIKPKAYAPDGPELTHLFAQNFPLKQEGRDILRALDLLFIDEVSTVRADLLDVIDTILRRIRRRPDEVFGGVQLCLIGDAFQLPPVVTNQQERALLDDHYPSLFFFSARCFQSAHWTAVELPVVMRQRDRQFVQLLNRVRTGTVTTPDLELLNSRVVGPSSVGPLEDGRVLLTPTRRAVAERNEAALIGLRTPSVYFEAALTGTFKEADMPTERRLRLKVGALVMFLTNAADQSYYNGRVGIVQEIGAASVTVVTEVGQPIEVTRHRWENVRFTYDRAAKQLHQQTVGTFTQFPLRLAYAITIHKSQGLTLDRAFVDLTDTFEDGMAYVALSRVRHVDGLLLSAPVTLDSIRVSSAATDFQRWVDGQQQTPSTAAGARVPRFAPPAVAPDQHTAGDAADSLVERVAQLEQQYAELRGILTQLGEVLRKL